MIRSCNGFCLPFFRFYSGIGFGEKFLSQDDSVKGEVEFKEKSTREQWSEQHQDHPVFKKGVQVRVAQENLLHKLRYSQIGKVVGHVNGEVCVQLEASLAPVVMPAEILVSNAEAPKFKPPQDISEGIK